MGCTYLSLQLKFKVCPCQTVLLLTVLYSPKLSSFNSWVRYSLGIYLRENFISFPLSKVSIPSLHLKCYSSIYCPEFSTVLISYFSSIKCSNRQKNLSLLLSPMVGFTLNLGCYLYNTLFIYCWKNTSWKFQQSKNSALQPFKS